MNALHSIKLIIGIVRDVLVIVFFVVLLFGMISLMQMFSQLSALAGGLA